MCKSISLMTWVNHHNIKLLLFRPIVNWAKFNSVLPQVVPTIIHYNMVQNVGDPNDVFCGFMARQTLEACEWSPPNIISCHNINQTYNSGLVWYWNGRAAVSSNWTSQTLLAWRNAHLFPENHRKPFLKAISISVHHLACSLWWNPKNLRKFRLRASHTQLHFLP